jgi:hypothetical protein
MKINRAKGSPSSARVAVGMVSVLMAGILGYSCNNQKSEAPKKSETQSASGENENRRNELAHSNTNSDRNSKNDQDDDKGSKSSSKSSSRSSSSSSSPNSSSTRSSNSKEDLKDIIARLGLTQGEVQTLQRFFCGKDPEELSRLASRFGFGGGGNGGSSNRNSFNLGSSGPGGFSRSDLDALRALGRSGRDMSPETIKRAQDALCNNNSSSSSSKSGSSSRSRSSRDDDDDDN